MIRLVLYIRLQVYGFSHLFNDDDGHMFLLVIMLVMRGRDFKLEVIEFGRSWVVIISVFLSC